MTVEGLEKQYWQLHEFSEKLGRHYTTVNDWFNKMENKNIHFVTRSENGERVYDAIN